MYEGRIITNIKTIPCRSALNALIRKTEVTPDGNSDTHRNRKHDTKGRHVNKSKNTEPSLMGLKI